MKSSIFFFPVSIILAIIFSPPLALCTENGEETPDVEYTEKKEFISLRTALELGMRVNYDQLIRHYKKEIYDIQITQNTIGFWTPNVAVVTNQNIPGLTNKNTQPSGDIGISIKPFNLFNWGQDYLEYKNKQDLNSKGQRNLREQQRELRYLLIYTYFSLAYRNVVEFIEKESLRHSSFFNRLVAQKIQLKMIPPLQGYQAKGYFLEQQQRYNQARLEHYNYAKKLGIILAKDSSILLANEENLEFMGLQLTYEIANMLAIENNPNYLDSKVTHKISTRNAELAIKNSLPLPKIDLHIGAYQNQFAPGFSFTQTNPHLDVSAMLMFTWTLWGEKGFSNYYEKTKADYLEKQASILVEQSTNKMQNEIRQKIKFCQLLEDRYSIIEQKIKNAKEKFNTIVQEFSQKTLSYLEVLEALKDLRDSEILLASIKLDHLKEKLELAYLAGVMDFPGENFELLAKRITL